MRERCPHANIVHCPLYVAAHIAGAPSCDDGKLDEMSGCAVDRNFEGYYGEKVAALSKMHPNIVIECAFAENAEAVRAQRSRNMRMAGIH